MFQYIQNIELYLPQFLMTLGICIREDMVSTAAPVLLFHMNHGISEEQE